MLRIDNQMKFSEYTNLYDVVVPKDNILRRIKENIDFSFVNEMLKKSYCINFGRPAKEPEMMFKILFLKRMYDLSDASLIENIGYNMSYKCFLNIDPEDKTVDSSLLTKFRKTRITEDILEDMLTETIKQAIEKGLIKSTAIIVDATHSESKTYAKTPTQILRSATKELRKQIYKNDIELADKFPEKPLDTADLNQEIEYSKKLVENLKEQLIKTDNEKTRKLFNKVNELLENDKIKEIQSAVDEDAKMGYKSETNNFFGYKSHIAMTEERLITGIEVTSGEAPDGKYLNKLVNKSKNNGINITEVLGDMAYSGKENLKLMKEQNIKVLSKLSPYIMNGNRTKNKDFEFIKDACMYKCPAGHLSIKKTINGTYNKSNKNKYNTKSLTYFFDIEKCKNCHKKEGCYNGSKSKTFSIALNEEITTEQKEFQESDYFRERIKQRYMIEAKNAEMKQAHGLHKCKYVGLFGMQNQIYFTAFVVNVKRMIKLIDKKVS